MKIWTVRKLTVLTVILLCATSTGTHIVRAQSASEPNPDFNELTAEGSGLIGDHTVSIDERPEGCGWWQPGTEPPGRFLVTIPSSSGADNDGCPLLNISCANYGDTVISDGVAVIFGSPGNDTIDQARIPADADVLIFGFGGNDDISPQNGGLHNYIIAGPGTDKVFSPVVDGDYGASIFGGNGGSSGLSGTLGDDLIVGGSSKDKLTGGDGADEMYGSGGDDVLDACPDDLNSDWMVGGDGRDTFKAAFFGGTLLDHIEDWVSPEHIDECD